MFWDVIYLFLFVYSFVYVLLGWVGFLGFLCVCVCVCELGGGGK